MLTHLLLRNVLHLLQSIYLTLGLLFHLPGAFGVIHSAVYLASGLEHSRTELVLTVDQIQRGCSNTDASAGLEALTTAVPSFLTARAI